MNLKLLTDVTRGDLVLDKDTVYPVADIIEKDYIVICPMEQKGKFKRVLILNDEGELVE